MRQKNWLETVIDKGIEELQNEQKQSNLFISNTSFFQENVDYQYYENGEDGYDKDC